jgi:hypothetical protein
MVTFFLLRFLKNLGIPKNLGIDLKNFRIDLKKIRIISKNLGLILNFLRLKISEYIFKNQIFDARKYQTISFKSMPKL